VSRRLFYLFLLSFSILSIYELLAYFGFALSVNPIGSGFNDDRLYIDKTFYSTHKTKTVFNLLYHFICYILLNNPYLIKVFNLVLYTATFHLIHLRALKESKKFLFTSFVLLLPTLVVISKEYLFIFLFISFLNAYFKPRNNLWILLGLLIFIASLRYWAVAVLLPLLFARIPFRVHIFFIPLLIYLIILNWNYIFQTLNEIIFIRFIEMSSEGSNYGLNSDSSSLSSRYSGNYLYDIFQLLFHPLVQKTYFLYNSYFFMPLMIIYGFLMFIIKKFHESLESKYLLFAFTLLLVALHFASNLRYKLILPFIFIFFLVQIKRKHTLFIPSIFGYILFQICVFSYRLL